MTKDTDPRVEKVLTGLIDLEAPAEHLPEPMCERLLTLIEQARSILDNNEATRSDEDTEEMIEAGASKIGGGSTFDHEDRREMAVEIYKAMRSGGG